MEETTVGTLDYGVSLLLPEDVVFQILIWLPVISLLRCKSVCKSWRRLIESSGFVHRHLYHYHSLKDDQYNLIVEESKLDNRSEYNSLNLAILYGADGYQVPLKLEFDAHCFLEFRYSGLDIATCNGIVCLHIQDRSGHTRGLRVALWNPATKQLRALPQSPSDPRKPSRWQPINIGFGYDAKTNDYKVVRICTDFDRRNGFTRVETYSLNSDSWRILDGLPVEAVYNSHDANEPHRNGGTYYWVGSKSFGNRQKDFLILSFDFSHETFATMPLPHNVEFIIKVKLAVIKEDLACINIVDDYFEIWVVREYGVQNPWSIFSKVGPFQDCCSLLGFPKNERFFFFLREQDIWVYDSVSLFVKRIHVDVGFISNLAFYQESLVSIKGCPCY